MEQEILNKMDVEHAASKVWNRKIPAKTNKMGRAGNTANLMVVLMLNEGTTQERLEKMSVMLNSLVNNQISEEIESGTVVGANSKGSRVADAKALTEVYHELNSHGVVSVETFNKWFSSESATVPCRIGKYWRQYAEMLNEVCGIHVSMPEYSQNKEHAVNLLNQCRELAPEHTL